MELPHLLSLAVICAVLIPAGLAVESPDELYWKTKLGDIPMPKVVKNSLLPGDANVVATDAGRQWHAEPNAGNRNYGRESHVMANEVATSAARQWHAQANAGNRNYGRESHVMANAVATSAARQWHAQANAGNRNYGRESHVMASTVATSAAQQWHAESNAGNRNYGRESHVSAEEELMNKKNDIFFVQNDLFQSGKRMKLPSMSDDGLAKFQPTKVTQEIPFSSDKMPEILKSFGIEPKSTKAIVMEETIRSCEMTAMNGEEKRCSDTLQDMVDFVVSKTGKRVKVYSTETNQATPMQYRLENAKKVSNDINMVCHKLSYPFAVFYCHSLQQTDLYSVSLVGSNGKKSKAIAICHKDTASWHPRHLAFQQLKVKPGSTPICHFLDVLTVIWVPY